LPLLGGFIFVTHWHPTKYSALRSADYRLFFMAAIAGAVFLLLASFSVLYIAETRIGVAIGGYWALLVPFEHSGRAAISFIMGALVWAPLNWLSMVPRLRWMGNRAAVDRAIERKQDALELLLRQSLGSGQPIAVTLKNGKVYIGNLTTNLNPAFRTESIHLLLHRSGHRHPETQKLEIDVDYDKTHKTIEAELRTKLLSKLSEALDKNPDMSLDTFKRIRNQLDQEHNLRNYEIAILISEVVSANVFDIELYDRHFKSSEPDTNESPLPF
jgi:hypothetical protein